MAKLDPKTRARLAALTMHARHPNAAKRNGRKGGQATSTKYKDGPKVWAARMALKRWHGLPFDYESDRPGE
jgi:hypothetical protein